MQAHPQSSPAWHPLPLPAAPTLSAGAITLMRAEDPRALAHDAGNLLGALSLYCGLLGQPGVLAPEHLHYVRELSLISDRSRRLVERMLHAPASLAKPSAGDGELAATGCHPATTLRALLPVLRTVAGPSVEVALIVAGALPRLPFAAEVLERLAVNLTRNAAEALAPAARGALVAAMALNPATGTATATDDIAAHASARGCIRLRLRRLAGDLLLEVEDDGPGLPPRVAAAFLNPAPMPEGAVRGFGHRIVHELAARTGGRLAVRVRPGRGTSIRITWPAAVLGSAAGSGGGARAFTPDAAYPAVHSAGS